MGITISTIFTAIFVGCIVICCLAGLLRGMARGIFSLILVLVCFGLIFALEGTITSTIMHLDVGGQTLKEAVTSALAQEPEMQNLVNKLVPLIEILIGIIAFVFGFVLLYMVSRVIYFIGKFFIRPEKKRRLLGALIGIVQGFIIAFVICVPINGVLFEVNKLSQIEVEGKQIISLDSIGFEEYKSSPINRILSGVGGGLFKEIAKYNDEDEGKIYTLEGQVDSVITVVKIAETVSTIGEINFEEGLTEENVGQVTEVLRGLDEIKNASSEEVLDTVDELIDAAIDLVSGGEEVEIDIDLSGISVKDVDFESEAVLVETVFDIVETGSFDALEDEDVDGLVEAFADSSLVLPIIEAAELEIELPEEVKDDIVASIEKLDDPEQVERLKTLFNLEGYVPQA